MLELANRYLRVHVLHPEEDQPRLGSRYCHGGYIWQVEDTTLGPLLSGPEGPERSPDPFNGYGLPEAFRHRTREGEPLSWRDGRGLAPGLGWFEQRDRGDVLVEPCRWQITRFHDRLMFATEQKQGDRGYALSRMVQLVDREVLSVTRLSNTGRAPLRLQWFAHPFFALGHDGRVTVNLPAGCSLPENPGFQLQDRTLTFRRRFHGVDDGQFVLLTCPAGEPLHASVSHPQLRAVEFSTSFAPDECPIWGNGYTFSIEPYQTLELQPVETRSWTLRYRFDV